MPFLKATKACCILLRAAMPRAPMKTRLWMSASFMLTLLFLATSGLSRAVAAVLPAG